MTPDSIEPKNDLPSQSKAADETAEGSESSLDRLSKPRYGFAFSVYDLEQSLNDIVSKGGPLILDVTTEKAIAQILCSPSLPSVDRISEKDKPLLYSSLVHIISQLKKINPKLTEAVECATKDLISDLKEQIKPSENSDKTKEGVIGDTREDFNMLYIQTVVIPNLPKHHFFVDGITNILEHLEEIKRKGKSVRDNRSLLDAIDMFLCRNTLVNGRDFPSVSELNDDQIKALDGVIFDIIDILGEMDPDLATVVALATTEFAMDIQRRIVYEISPKE